MLSLISINKIKNKLYTFTFNLFFEQIEISNLKN